ncbi:biotin/lipoyl-containing protein [Flagellimonas sp.]|uniref:biotin/lipoyl-containing protein n=1 Tax=Flagellimonas sp. TaxID=2058762 RepID=UPI003BB0C7A5
MRRWLLKQMDKWGLDSSNLKTEAELKGRFLELGESQEIIFPEELIEDSEWRIVEWFFKKGEIVNPGDVIGAVENRRKRFEFETYVGGSLNYYKQVGQKVEGGTVLAKITGAIRK